MNKLLEKLTNMLKKRAKSRNRAEPQLPVVHISDTLLSETGRLRFGRCSVLVRA
jgi:hypothetical protein